MTLSSNESEASKNGGPIISRRTTVLAAAWSVPVIAAAVATPLASASAAQASIAAIVGGGISADGTAGTASGQFSTSGIQIADVVGEWSTGALTASYRITGPWASAAIVKTDGSPFTQGEVITDGGTVWTVSFVDVDGADTWEVQFTSASVTVSTDTIIAMPPARYAGTFSPGVPNRRNPIQGTVSVAAANINGGVAVAASASYPA